MSDLAFTAAAADREALQLVLQQAEDEGLWFKAETAAEAYLQQELRRLHAAIEASQAKAGAPHQGELHAKETSRQATSTVGTVVGAGDRHNLACDPSGQALRRTSSAAILAGGPEPDTGVRQDAGEVAAISHVAVAPQSAGEPEIRRNEDGTLDEVVGTGDLHLEQMSGSHWWMALQYGEHRITVNFHSKRTIHASAEYERQLASGSGSGSD